jgi:uncharacterized membrane protein YfcA
MWLPKKAYNGKDPSAVVTTTAGVCAGQVAIASLLPPPFPLLVFPASLLLVLWLTYMPARKKSLGLQKPSEPIPTITYTKPPASRLL